MSTADHSAIMSSRGVRAACEALACARIAPGLWLVDNGATDPKEHAQYHVEPDAPACECGDWRHRSEELGEEGCKHIRRVRMERGDLDVSPLLEADDVDLYTVLENRLDTDTAGAHQ